MVLQFSVKPPKQAKYRLFRSKIRAQKAIAMQMNETAT
jgi:hypothetical protein